MLSISDFEIGCLYAIIDKVSMAAVDSRFFDWCVNLVPLLASLAGLVMRLYLSGVLKSWKQYSSCAYFTSRRRAGAVTSSSETSVPNISCRQATRSPMRLGGGEQKMRAAIWF